MSTITTALVALVMIEHVYFMILEMFLWTKPRARKAFGMTEEMAKATAKLAANQGLYNGFLAVGLLWSLVAANDTAPSLRIFFLSCVALAGIYGGATVTRKIFYIQAVPAGLALALQIFGR